MLQGYKHTAAEIRKSVVFALVELHMILGPTLTPHLSPLTSSQSKLLKIYIKRAEVNHELSLSSVSNNVQEKQAETL